MKSVIVIGGGLAGLTAGIYCRKNGLRCTVLEKHSECGGNLTGWSREGCYIDNCIHWLVGTNENTNLYRTWNEIGMITDSDGLYQADSFFESEKDGERIAFSRDAETTRINMRILSPQDGREIDRFIDCVKSAARFMTEGKSVFGTLSAYTAYRGITLAELSNRFKHPLLRYAFTDYIGGEFSAITLVWAYAAFTCGNGMIPRGGSKNAAERIKNKYLKLGGELRLSSEAERILIDGKRAVGVMLNNGQLLFGDCVICACDPKITFGRLLSDRYMPRQLYKLYRDKESCPRFSSVHGAFLCPSDSIPRFGTRVIDCNYGEARRGGRMIVKEYSYEPSFAPNGFTVVQTMIFLDERECNRWIIASKNKSGYEAGKDDLSRSMRLALIKAFPAVADSLKPLDTWTPATYNRYFGAEFGEYMSFALTPKTPLHRMTSKIRGLDNVFIATQWQCSPGGLPNAVRAGISAAKNAKSVSKIR